ncbi:hypothetical protein B0T25DRAFT_232042 [Lasiosphaeria hispida]|uniref:CFEM domain-containing protein n=1 Tax=Lasiosphaeria hispida TaxID=260671 RepID=A0AAJ0HDP9_9PEZI|nr:hypothetical protein B0T25DRAFT_232042 [Lasiosphaeria hispida]
MHFQLLTLAVLSTLTLAQLPTSTLSIPSISTPSLTIATVPNPLPTGTSLPALVSQLPACAVPCFDTAARQISCTPTDFSCLCRSDKTTSFSINMASCLGGVTLFGDDDNDDVKDECDDLDDLAELAGKICVAVAAGPDQSQLAAATTAVSQALARASATGSGAAPSATSATGRPNEAGRGVDRASTGMLAAVVAYAVLVL